MTAIKPTEINASIRNQEKSLNDRLSCVKEEIAELRSNKGFFQFFVKKTFQLML